MPLTNPGEWLGEGLIHGRRSVASGIRNRRSALQKEGEVLVKNEAFLIGILQGVSGGSLFAGLLAGPGLPLNGLPAACRCFDSSRR